MSFWESARRPHPRTSAAKTGKHRAGGYGWSPSYSNNTLREPTFLPVLIQCISESLCGRARAVERAIGFLLDRPFKPTKFLVFQPDGHRIFGVADEFERGVVIVAENFMSKRFI